MKWHPRSLPARYGSLFTIVIALLSLLAFPVCTQGAEGEVTLEWDPNPEPEVSGYRLHMGAEPGTYNQTRDAGNQTTIAVSELVAGQTYFFVVTAYDALGNESLPSNEVSFNVPWPAKLLTAALSPGNGTAGSPRCEPAFEKTSPAFGMQIEAPEWSAVTIFASQDMQSWTALGTIPNTSGRVLVRDLGSVEFPKRFYRAGKAQSLPP